MIKKCYHMTNKLEKILGKKEPQLKAIVGDSSKLVNDIKNIGISYSLGLEGIIATNAMFRARYQYNLLENQTNRDVTLDDMFAQDISETENNFLGSYIYLTFNETEQIRMENEERDIADPKTKGPIDIENIKGVVLKNNKTGDIKYDRESVIRYAISNTNMNIVLDNLINSDRLFMNMEGYGKTDFTFKDYVKRYYEEISKDPKTNEFNNNGYKLEEIDVKELLKLVEISKEKNLTEELPKKTNKILEWFKNLKAKITNKLKNEDKTLLLNSGEEVNSLSVKRNEFVENIKVSNEDLVTQMENGLQQEPKKEIEKEEFMR